MTVNQGAGQADPASVSPVSYTVVFTEVVYGFAGSHVTLSGTAGASTVTIGGTGPTYGLGVSGMLRAGTVIATIAAGQVTDAAGNAGLASTSTDNTVTSAGP